ncbi:MAG: hypothetical protein NVS4B8_17010 [Herpetosiphon sp.]
MHELFNEATREEGDDIRIVEAELTIRAVPITEVDYTLRGKPRTLAIIGFDSSVRGDLSLWDTERLLVVAAFLVMVILLVVLFVHRA